MEYAQKARAPPTCTQPILGRWATGQDFQMVVGRKRGLYGGSCSSFFRERCLAGMVSHPKEVSMGWDYLMYAIEIGDERARSLSR